MMLKNNKMDKKVLLSTLWIFEIFDYLYCNIMGPIVGQTLLPE